MWNSFQKVAEKYSARIAVSNEAGQSTYEDLRLGARRLQKFLSETSHPIVLVALPGGPDFTITQLGVWATDGGVVAPISERSTSREARAVLDIIKPNLLIVDSLDEQSHIVDVTPESIPIVCFKKPVDEYKNRCVILFESIEKEDSLEDSRHELPEGTRLIQFTSGSTGKPKGILISEENLLANLRKNKAHFSVFANQSVFSSLPQFHAMGGAIVWEHLWHGSFVHLANNFMPGEHIARMVRYDCTALYSAPNYLKLMLDLGALDPEKLLQLQSFTLGSAAVEPKLIEKLYVRFPDAVTYCRYGLSESVGALTLLAIQSGDSVPAACVGSALDGVEFSGHFLSGESSEISVRSDCAAEFYIQKKGHVFSLKDKHGWLHTGDLGCLDEMGRLHLSGRKSAFIKVNGFRVSAQEIELMLRSVEGVQEAIVLGVPDESSGQSIVAFIEPLPGHILPDSNELQELCRAELAPYKIPRRFLELEKLPRTAAGKPDRQKIMQEVH